jgi:large subunit ribosomal protein L25
MIELKAERRTVTGKKVARLRMQGLMPAVVYGEKINAQAIAVPLVSFAKVLKEAGESVVVMLNVEGASHNVLIHDIAYDPIQGLPIHADFHAVRMDKVLRVKVAFAFAGEAPAVKDLGGVLVKVLHEVEVEAFPQNLPHELMVDISALIDFNARIFVKDIILPKGVAIPGAIDDVIALVEPPRSEEELADLTKAPEEGVVAVQTEQEKVRAEKEKAEAETKKATE